MEEAHNLLKATNGKDSELIGKSVEMLTQTIAEIRTFGEGFVIVDQSPSSVDIAAIKNTNTKIVLRTPEAKDRESVGKSMGLTDDQLNEIAKLPAGVAVVYQNNWVAPVLTLINKADVSEVPYCNNKHNVIMTKKTARTNIIKMVMQPWIKGKLISENILQESLKILDLSLNERKRLKSLIADYSLFNGMLSWKESEIGTVRDLTQTVLGITEKEYAQIDSAEDLERLVSSKIKSLTNIEVSLADFPELLKQAIYVC